MMPSDARPELSIVIPALNEQDNVKALVDDVRRSVCEQGVDAELIIVDDGSTDLTLARLRELRGSCPWLVVLHRARAQGQSAAMFAGIQHARGRYIATLDGDLQNDPADLVLMLEKLKRENADFVQGDRSRNRRDNMVRRVTSIIGRKARAWIVGDPVRDTGCSARVARAEVMKRIPLQFKGIHRFMPAYARLSGAKVIEMPVNHRPRSAGETKYGLGISKRAWSGLLDCFAVRWMATRYRDAAVIPDGNATEPSDAAKAS